LNVRKARIEDLSYLVEFTAEEAIEAEGTVKIPDTLEKGIGAALADNSIAIGCRFFITTKNKIRSFYFSELP
jgi:hypothetical protein